MHCLIDSADRFYSGTQVALMENTLKSRYQRVRGSRRSTRGASLFLIALAAFLLAYLIYLGFQYCLLTGGSREVRNGVDASVLNLSKRVCEVRVSPGAAYRDVADSAGTISMTNINRLWGKAYLINANVDEMKHEQLVTADAVGAGELAYQLAQDVNDELRAGVTNKGTLDALFSHMSNKRGAPLLGASKIDNTVEAGYPIALVDRGAESNLSFDPASLPKGAQPEQVCAGNTSYIQGYTPFTANGKTFCFTPFRLGETPHLIADSYFNGNRADSRPLPDYAMAIPNAFQGHGTAFGTGTSLAAAASAVVNPMQQYQLAIPHGFIRIHFTSISKWTIDDKPAARDIPYGPDSGKVWGIRDYRLKGTDGKPGSRILNGWAELGMEFKKPSLMAVIDAVPADHVPALQRLLQRAQEIEPGFSMGRLQSLLQKQKPDPAVTTYYIFPRYTTADLTDPVLEMAPAGKLLPEWLRVAAAGEGGSKEVVKESVLEDHEHATVYIMGGNPDCPKWMEITGSMMWRPGTGMQQCLGTLYVNRITRVKYQPGTEGGSGGGS